MIESDQTKKIKKIEIVKNIYSYRKSSRAVYDVINVRSLFLFYIFYKDGNNF